MSANLDVVPDPRLFFKKKTAVLIDGPSLHCMGQILDIGAFDYEGLFSILSNLSVRGSNGFLGGPKYVMGPRSVFKKGDLLEKCGFDVISASSIESQDDAWIRDYIVRLSTNEVDEIILVGADRAAYFAALDSKKKLGCRILIVGTDKRDRSGNSMLSKEMRNGFEFIELNNFRDRITRLNLLEASRAQGSPEQPKINHVGDGKTLEVRIRGYIYKPGDQARVTKILEDAVKELVDPEMTITTRYL